MKRSAFPGSNKVIQEERRKLLVVSMSVGVFCIIILGASVLFFTPHGSNEAGSQSSLIAVGSESGENNLFTQGTKPEPAAPQQPANSGGEAAAPGTAQGGGTLTLGPNSVITIMPAGSQPSAAAGQNTQTAAPESTAAVASAPAPKPAANAAKPAAKAAPRAVPKKAASPAKHRAAAPASSEWWVQAGSFATRNNADAAKQTLDKKGLGSIITSAAVGSRTWYRVRVGPYNSKNEAAYWQGLIKSVKGCSDAIVVKSR
jgi:DedD protein